MYHEREPLSGLCTAVALETSTSPTSAGALQSPMVPRKYLRDTSAPEALNPTSELHPGVEDARSTLASPSSLTTAADSMCPIPTKCLQGASKGSFVGDKTRTPSSSPASVSLASRMLPVPLALLGIPGAPTSKNVTFVVWLYHDATEWPMRAPGRPVTPRASLVLPRKATRDARDAFSKRSQATPPLLSCTEESDGAPTNTSASSRLPPLAGWVAQAVPTPLCSPAQGLSPSTPEPTSSIPLTTRAPDQVIRIVANHSPPSPLPRPGEPMSKAWRSGSRVSNGHRQAPNSSAGWTPICNTAFASKNGLA